MEEKRKWFTPAQMQLAKKTSKYSSWTRLSPEHPDYGKHEAYNGVKVQYSVKPDTMRERDFWFLMAEIKLLLNTGAYFIEARIYHNLKTDPHKEPIVIVYPDGTEVWRENPKDYQPNPNIPDYLSEE